MKPKEVIKAFSFSPFFIQALGTKITDALGSIPRNEFVGFEDLSRFSGLP